MKHIMFLCILVANAVIFTAWAVEPCAKVEIVTMELTAPDGQKTTVRSIVGGAPVTITDKNGDTWMIHIKAVETK